MTRIALHTFTYCNAPAIVSTVEIFGDYETMVMFEDGTEIECFYSDTLEEAKATHNKTVNTYNDMLYEGSINKKLGAMNYGQFVKTVVAC